MVQHIYQYLFIALCVIFLCGADVSASDNELSRCNPLTNENTLDIRILPSASEEGEVYNLFVTLADDFRGRMRLNTEMSRNRHVAVVCNADTIMLLAPVMDDGGRSCRFKPAFPAGEGECAIIIPNGYFEISPLDYIEVDEIDIDEDLLSDLAVAGAWHKNGGNWNGPAMFSIIDDDGLDCQINEESSPLGGYFSTLYPLLESLGLRGNLAVEGRRIGFNSNPPAINDNLKTILRLQNEKGWEVLSHSMSCLGEILNNWLVDGLTSKLAKEILSSGPNNGVSAFTVSVYDLKTRKQYWPDSESKEWVETPSVFIKPYVGDYKTKKPVMYNPDFDIDWHWGEWKRRAIAVGIDPKGFVTHNATSSHALVKGIMKYFPHGFSDLSAKNINTVPMLSSAVRAGLEGQSLKGYDGNSTDNKFNAKHFKAFCKLIDEAAASGGWIMFNLHAYRPCWQNYIRGALVSEGGSYPDEWVLPLKGIDSTTGALSPPEELGIEDWSEWEPCPGTRLYMMWRILKYAKEKGLVNVSSSEGFKIMGNKKATGYFNQGYAFGMDAVGICGTRSIYPHYVKSASDEEFYYNTLISDEIIIDADSLISALDTESGGKFTKFGTTIIWEGEGFAEIRLKAFDLSGREILSSGNNLIDLGDFIKGTYFIVALKGKSRARSVKILI